MGFDEIEHMNLSNVQLTNRTRIIHSKAQTKRKMCFVQHKNTK